MLVLIEYHIRTQNTKLHSSLLPNIKLIICDDIKETGHLLDICTEFSQINKKKQHCDSFKACFWKDGTPLYAQALIVLSSQMYSPFIFVSARMKR